MPINKKLIISSCLILLVLAGCSLFPPPRQRAELLRENINKYQNFTLSGIAEINYKNFTFRKNLQLKNTPEKFSASLVEGGVFGMKAAPLASLEIGQEVEFQFMGKTQAVPLTSSDLQQIFSPDLLDKYSSTICSELQLSLDNLEIFWNEAMQIEEIVTPKFRVRLEYDLNQDLQYIKLWQQQDLVLKVSVDEIKYN
ncbi:MAG: hypothetical protein R6U84_08305 [Candidatus Cloacimonadales bacterium]